MNDENLKLWRKVTSEPVELVSVCSAHYWSLSYHCLLLLVLHSDLPTLWCAMYTVQSQMCAGWRTTSEVRWVKVWFASVIVRVEAMVVVVIDNQVGDFVTLEISLKTGDSRSSLQGPRSRLGALSLSSETSC